MKKILAGLFVLTLMGCASPQWSQERQNFDRFKDIPVPERSLLDNRETSVIGKDNDWWGVIAFSAPYNLGAIFEYYTKEMKLFGWTQLTFSRGDFQQSLIFTKNNRIAQISFTEHALDGTHIKFVMSPRTEGVE
ncbi:MAG: hypothetical protein JXR30_03495 [Alphaproteobacteria bacterium]|nr:hypothetical protein [Alphaproteobacteria bacterium]